MLVDGKDYKINILILFMEDEIDVTVHTVEMLLDSLEDGVVISVLLNGGTNPELRVLFGRDERVRYYESDRNLGVAGGRNFIFKTEECMGADIIFSLDNDVIVPIDYVRGLATFLLRHKDAGIVGPIIADINKSEEFYEKKYYKEIGVFGNKICRVGSKEVKDSYKERLVPGMLFHMGVHPDYYYAYFSIKCNLYKFFSRIFAILGIPFDFDPFLVNNRSYLKRILRGEEKYEVSNVGGGSSVFRRKLVDELGPYNDSFNPYGFEDVDFAIRTLRAGYKNYIDTNTWLLHGTDTRHKKRDFYKVLANNIKSRTVLASTTFPEGKVYRSMMLKYIYYLFFLELAGLRGTARKSFRARLEGFRRGERIVEEGTPGETELQMT